MRPRNVVLRIFAAAIKEERMSPRRFLGEILVMLGVIVGTVIGYLAGEAYNAYWQMCFAFLGMALGGAFTDICLRGGK